MQKKYLKRVKKILCCLIAITLMLGIMEIPVSAANVQDTSWEFYLQYGSDYYT